MSVAFISIGSNIDPLRHVRAAVKALRDHYGALQVSSVYESHAEGFDGANFYNLVVGFETSVSPQTIQRTLRRIEDENGRERGGNKFAPRTLDLDLLLYDNAVLEQPQLPRDEIERYAFVLCPLAEIAGDWQHPISGRRYADLWREFDKASQALWRVTVKL